MKEIEAQRLKLAAMELVEGTELKWEDVIRHKPRKEALKARLEMFCIGDIELALGIVEGKPVWEGDQIYNHYGKAVAHEEDRERLDWSRCSWLPPKPNTAMVELLVTDVEMYVNAEFCGKRLSEACRKTLAELK